MYKCKYKCRVEHGTDVDEMESADFAQRYALTLALPMTARCGDQWIRPRAYGCEWMRTRRSHESQSHDGLDNT